MHFHFIRVSISYRVRIRVIIEMVSYPKRISDLLNLPCIKFYFDNTKLLYLYTFLILFLTLERFSGYAVCGFRGLWNMLFLMKGGIRNRLAAVCMDLL